MQDDGNAIHGLSSLQRGAANSEAGGYLFFPEKLRVRQKLLQYTLDEELPRFDSRDFRITVYTGTEPDCPVFMVGASAEEALWQSCGKGCFRIFLRENRLCFEFANAGEPVRILPEYCRLWPELNFHISADGKLARPSADQLEVHLQKTAEGGILQMDLQFLQFFRHSPQTPMRFNLAIGEVFLQEMRKVPERLLMGNLDSHDLLWLRFQ